MVARFFRVGARGARRTLLTVFFWLAPTWAAEVAPISESADAANRVTPPVLVHFEAAPYPPEAEQAGLQATVVMRLDIAANGEVTAAAVVEPAGHGFDEAASEAARRFVFTPAKRGGEPIASRILYRYVFKLEPPPEPIHRSATHPVIPGELRGSVVGGGPPVPIAGVEVRAQGPDQRELQTRTDPSGQFVFSNLPPGEYTLRIHTAGFEPVQFGERVAANQATSLVYTLVPTRTDAIEVTVHGAALHREVTHYELTRQELLRTPGTMGDAVHAVEAMPSVARPPAFSGQLIVRGSAAEDTQVFVEGTPIRRVFHFGSLSSVVPSEMIERLQFYPSNFSVRYGRGMGGVVELGLRLTHPDGKHHGSAQMDFINLRANVEGPVPGLRKWSFMAGGRMSYVDRWLVPVLRSSGSALEGMPRYSDYQMYLERPLARNGVIRIGFFGAQDKYVPIEKNPREWNAPTDAFGHVQTLLRIPLSSTVNLRASWSMGRTETTEYGAANRKFPYSTNLSTARAELSAATGRYGIARIGADAMYAPFSLQAVTDVEQAGGALASENTGAPRLRALALHGVYFRPATFAEYESSSPASACSTSPLNRVRLCPSSVSPA